MPAAPRRMLLYIAALPVFAGSGLDARGFDPDAYLNFKQATETAISPDGAQVAFTVAVYDPASDLQQSQLWVVSARGGSPRLIGNGESAQWCAHIGLVSLRRQGDKLQLQVSDGSSQPRPLLPGVVNVGSFACDPTSGRLAIVGTESASEPPNKLLLADFAAGTVRKLVDGVAADAEWSPSGTAIAASIDDDIELVGLDGKRTPLVKRPGRDLAPHWSPNGMQIAFATQDGEAAGPIALSTVAAAGGEPRPVGRSFTAWLRGQPPRWVQWIDDGRLAFTGLSRMRTHLYRVDLKRPAVVKDLTPGDPVYSGCSRSNRGKAYACVQSSWLSPPEIVLRSFANKSEKQLTRLNPGLDLGGDEIIREVQWQSADGTDITGLLALPAHSIGPLPLVVLNVGSHGTYDHSFTTRVSADDSWFPAINHHLLTAQGYAVLMPNPRGSWGFGEAFQNKVTGDPAVGPFADIQSGVDSLIKEGIADPKRLAIIATGTYDAYRSVYGLTQTSRYRAAVLTVPVVDLVHVYALAGGAVSARYLGGSPLAEPAKFDPINPIRHASAIKTPTLIFKVSAPPFEAQADLLAAALRENKVPVEVKPASERFSEPSRVSETRDAIVATLKWLRTYLQADRTLDRH